MRNPTRFLTILFLLSLAACNFPTPGLSGLPTSEPSPSAANETLQVPQPSDTPAAAPAESESAPTSTATTALTPTARISGPIPHLAGGTPLAISFIDMADAEKGWAIGGAADGEPQEHVFRTSDGGSTWVDVTPPEITGDQADATRIAVGGFWNADTAMATFYSSNLAQPSSAPVVWKTVDGGATWTPSAPLDLSGWKGEYRVSDVFYINLNTGWMLIHKGDDPASDRIALYQTLNGGATWELKINPDVDSPVQECEKTGILFTGPWNGWLTGDCRGNRTGVFLYQTFDGGKSWIEAKLPSPATPPGLFTTTDFACRIHPPVFFAQKTNLILCVECTSKTTPTTAAYLFSSNLDGSNWYTMPYPGGQMAVRSAGDGRVFRGDVVSGLAVGKDIYSYNGKEEIWEKIGSIDWTGRIDFIDWNIGWAAARKDGNPLLMYTDDGGRTWNALSPIISAGG
jgi:photosystem II stability/assembly factor-like uncharacterized protein